MEYYRGHRLAPEEIDIDKIVKTYQEIQKKKADFKKKTETPGYKITEADTLEYQQLESREAKEVDSKINKIVDGYKADAQQSKEFLDRFKQGIDQNLHQQQAGLFTYLSAIAASVGLKIAGDVHEDKYGIAAPRRRASSAVRRKTINNKMPKIIKHKFVTLGR